MKRLALCIPVLLCTSVLYAKPPQCAVSPPKPKQCALLSGCACGATCTCTAGECGDPNCASLKAKAKLSLLDIAMDQAVRENKPLLIWVGVVCLPCEKSMPDYVHCHVERYVGQNDEVTGPAVIVGRPDGQGGLIRVATLDGIPSASQVASVLSSGVQSTPQAQPAAYYQPSLLPLVSPPLDNRFFPDRGGFRLFGRMGGGGCST